MKKYNINIPLLSEIFAVAPVVGVYYLNLKQNYR